MRYIMDSYSWLEYPMGTEAKVKQIIDTETDEKLTPSICLAETYAKILKTEDKAKAEVRRAFIKSRGALVPLDENLAVAAAKTDIAMKKSAKLGLADSIVLSTARDRKARVVTRDPHFRGLDEAYMV